MRQKRLGVGNRKQNGMSSMKAKPHNWMHVFALIRTHARVSMTYRCNLCRYTCPMQGNQALIQEQKSVEKKAPEALKPHGVGSDDR